MKSPWNHHENPAPSISHENHHNFTHPRIAKAWHCPKPDDFEEYGCYAGAGTVGSTEALFLSEGWCFPREKWWIWWPEKGWKMEKKWRKMVKNGETWRKHCEKWWNMEVYSWVCKTSRNSILIFQPCDDTSDPGISFRWSFDVTSFLRATARTVQHQLICHV